MSDDRKQVRRVVAVYLAEVAMHSTSYLTALVSDMNDWLRKLDIRLYLLYGGRPVDGVDTMSTHC